MYVESFHTISTRLMRKEGFDANYGKQGKLQCTRPKCGDHQRTSLLVIPLAIVLTGRLQPPREGVCL